MRRHITDPDELAQIMRRVKDADYIIHPAGPPSIVAGPVDGLETAEDVKAFISGIIGRNEES